MTKPTNIQYLDTLRALATLGVIVIHVSSPVLNMTFMKNMNLWHIGNLVDSSVRFAVPLFLMLSGATMLNREYSLGEFYKKRMMRVLVPFLFWMVVNWIFRWLMLSPKKQPEGFSNIMQWAVNLLLNEGISKHFWYIYMILFIYLFVPFIGKAVRKASDPALLYCLLAWVVLCIATYSMNLSFYKWTGDYHLKLLGYVEYSGFLVLGYYLAKMTTNRNKTRLIAGLAFIASVAVCATVAYLMSNSGHGLNLRIYSYLSVSTIIQSVAVFLLVKDSSIKNKFACRVQKTISDYSYGIYLVHIIVIGVLFRNGIYWSFAHPLISLPGLTVMVLVCSFAIIFVLRKVPLGKYVAG